MAVTCRVRVGGQLRGCREPYGLGFVAVEENGVWGKATEVPGLAALNTGGDVYISSVSCAPASACSAGGPRRRGVGPADGYGHHYAGWLVIRDNV